jgi:adenylate cyclase
MADDDTGNDGFWKKVGARAQKIEQSESLVKAARKLREKLPGDAAFGDPLSTAGSEQPQVVGRRLSALTAERPGLLRETGLSALQVWESISEKQGRGRGKERVAVVFTDLAAFSEWALKVGDDEAVRLLREVDCAMEPAMRERGGKVVKRMGDGLMAVFSDSGDALDALLDARERLTDVKADGYEPRFRAGIHVGKPRKLGGDYFGVDVNIAARLAEQAAPDEVLVSDAALHHLDTDDLKVKKKRRFKVKGVPDDLQAYSITPQG